MGRSHLQKRDVPFQHYQLEIQHLLPNMINQSHVIVQKQTNESPVSSAQISIIATTLLGILLRLYQLGAESLWVDEYFSIDDAVNLNLCTRPLYYFLLHVWMEFGGDDSDVWLRLLSIPFSVGTIGLIYLLGRKLLSERTAQIAAFMAAVSPLFIGYGQEIRMYALSAFLTLAGTILLVLVLKSASKLKVAAWAFVRWLAIITTPLNIVLLFPDFLICLWHFRRQFSKLWMIGLGVLFTAAATFPIMLLLRTRAPEFMSSWVATKSKPDLLKIGGMLTEFTMFWPLTDLPKPNELSLSSAGLQELQLSFFMLATGLVWALLLWGLYQSVATFKQQQAVHNSLQHLLWIAAWGLLPNLVILAVSYTASTIWFARYLLFTAPYLLLLLAASFELCWTRYRKLGIAIASVYLVAVSGGLFHYYTKLYHDDWQGIAAVIQANEQPGDVIGLYPHHWNPVYTLPRYYRGGSSIYTLATPEELDTPIKQPIEPRIDSMLNRLPATAGRYWIVAYYPQSHVIDALVDEIEERYTLLEAEQFPNSVNADIHLFLAAPRVAN